jgi:hypothetical protein
VQESVILSPGQQVVVDTLAAPAKALMDTPQIAETIQKGVNTFMEAVPTLMKALDEVAKVHPFISGASPFYHRCGMVDDDRFHTVAVLAFKAVYTLEKKRHENDKRVLALYVEYVASNFDGAPSSHTFQDERYDGGSRAVRVHFYLIVFLSDRPTSRLKDVSDPKQIAPDGQTIEGRMQKLCEAVAGDIKKCANACDTYLRRAHTRL